MTLKRHLLSSPAVLALDAYMSRQLGSAFASGFAALLPQTGLRPWPSPSRVLSAQVSVRPPHPAAGRTVVTDLVLPIWYHARMAKKRVPIPRAVAARVLFSSDRTCCVCRIAGKRVQIHHIDDNPSNNEPSNLAVLCFECHGDTQTTGGFGRQLDAEQVRLYRDDWHRTIDARRVQNYRDTRDNIELESNRIKYITALIERLRENQDYSMLASIYNDMDNSELRDKYIDLALEQDNSDWYVIHLRSMQDRRDLIPSDVADRRLNEQSVTEDWSQRARTLVDLGRYVEAVHDYVKSVIEDLEEGRVFAAGYYLKELFEEGLVDCLFERALQDAAEENDLWWQVRSLQELGWDSELKEFLLANEDKIKASGSMLLNSYLLRAKGDQEGADKASIEFSASRGTDRVILFDDEQDDDNLGDDDAEG